MQYYGPRSSLSPTWLTSTQGLVRHSANSAQAQTAKTTGENIHTKRIAKAYRGHVTIFSAEEDSGRVELHNLIQKAILILIFRAPY